MRSVCPALVLENTVARRVVVPSPIPDQRGAFADLVGQNPWQKVVRIMIIRNVIKVVEAGRRIWRKVGSSHKGHHPIGQQRCCKRALRELIGARDVLVFACRRMIPKGCGGVRTIGE